MSGRDLRMEFRYIVAYRNAKGAATGFLGPFSKRRAHAEREWHLAKHPDARASVFLISRDVASRVPA